ncbi:hypothetical protein HFP89_13985 [Wenzhouxiangella sp. XN79A]|uniref:hypothetical protein n=1 Tax=Wenzhouxiangella sp. XN79A TaxID=2724193 RepID=UPI00144A7A51|nr:hypothetical protein [Wenzhouxiangella sp. XN79A]NKI36275.1 hypothetical protein [Wenzhouxiangella sp. XN79A]
MTRLTQEERTALGALEPGALGQPELTDAERLVLPNPRARADYVRFATAASRFFRGRKEIGFRGENWRL